MTFVVEGIVKFSDHNWAVHHSLMITALMNCHTSISRFASPSPNVKAKTNLLVLECVWGFPVQIRLVLPTFALV